MDGCESDERSVGRDDWQSVGVLQQGLSIRKAAGFDDRRRNMRLNT